MSAPIVRRFPDAEPVSRAAAEEFVRRAAEAIAARGRFTVALSGGSTPRRLYQLLAGEPYRGQVDWGRVEVFWGDERSVPPDDKESNYRMAREAMLTALALPPGHVHRMEAERADRDTAAREYQAEIARAFGVDANGEPPAFDLILLGMGPDGHTASLFPHTAALGETKRWVVVNHVPKFNTDRMTLTYPVLNRACEVLFLVAGADKAEPLAEVLQGPPDPERLPSQRVRPTDGQLLFFVDRAAAARLTLPVTDEG
ncbi:MAG TPA: 6-phosphogluconolactonase [Gemmataceae bacterium]|jgi:6-phosphogluconolactonase|nr:6-phosphogluconolactonase [Gemmataceae bacterium]